MGTSTHFYDIYPSQFVYFNWKRWRLVVINTELSSSIWTPSVVKIIIRLIYFSNWMVSSTPYVNNVIQAYAIESQWRLCFSTVIYSSSCCKRFWLSSAEKLLIYQDNRVIGSWNYFVNAFVLVPHINFLSEKFDWLENGVGHLLSTLEIIVAREIYRSIHTVGKERVVIASRN